MSDSYPDKSAVAEHYFETGHKMDFPATTVLARTSGYWDSVIREALEINLEPNLLNRDSGLPLSNAWKPAIALLEPRKKSPAVIGPRTAKQEAADTCLVQAQ